MAEMSILKLAAFTGTVVGIATYIVFRSFLLRNKAKKVEWYEDWPDLHPEPIKYTGYKTDEKSYNANNAISLIFGVIFGLLAAVYVFSMF